jgi:solute carrier family 35 protein F5
MLLTSPLIATLGLSLTIPAAVVVDTIRGKSFTWLYLAGALLVLAGFVVTTAADRRKQKERK